MAETTVTTEGKIIGHFAKSDNAAIVARVSIFKNSPRIDIREFIQTAKYSGGTQKGINFDAENFMEFYKLVEQIKIHLEEEGMLQE